MVADSGRRGYSLLLQEFWDDAQSRGLPLPTEQPISAASFCRARPKITSELLKYMLHEVAASSLEESFGQERWHGRRVFAADGTKVNLQPCDDLKDAFGIPASGNCPQVLVSTLYDVCAKLPIDVQVESYASCERKVLLKMLDSLAPNDVLVLDRGYPGHEVVQELAAAKVDFLIRVPENGTFLVVEELKQLGARDAVLRLDPYPGAPKAWRSMDVRVIRRKRKDGPDAYFVTSLTGDEYTAEDLADLYHMRWEVEELYKQIKGPYIGQGQLHSKSPEGVRQEIHALLLFMAITRVVAAAAATSSGIALHEVSQKAAVLGVASYLTRLMLGSSRDPAIRDELRALLRRLSQARYKRRPDRSYPRRSFKPHPKWNGKGRMRG